MLRFVISAFAVLLCFPSLGNLVAQDATQTTLVHSKKFLDQKQIDWFKWSGSKRGDTNCVSCHTNATYLLARPTIHRAVKNDSSTTLEELLVRNAIKRVGNWKTNRPYYGGRRADSSRGTESVINALTLSSYDQMLNRKEPSEETIAALKIMWSEQKTEGSTQGAWAWLNFNLEPWESKQAEYFGAALAAFAVARTPGNYSRSEEIKQNLSSLKTYLATPFKQSKLSAYHQAYLLWVSTEFDGLISREEQKRIAMNLAKLQNEDGGWALAKLGKWKRLDDSDAATESDGYATGLVVNVLLRVDQNGNKKTLQRGLKWLNDNFDSEKASWIGISPNVDRSESSDRVKGFMTTAATALAALALAENHVRQSSSNSVSQADIEKAKRNVRVYSQTCKMYRLDVGKPPKTLESLIHRPKTGNESRLWRGPYLATSKIPHDPWGNPYILKTDPNTNVSYVFSAGPDGKENTDDDIGRKK